MQKRLGLSLKPHGELAAIPQNPYLQFPYGLFAKKLASLTVGTVSSNYTQFNLSSSTKWEEILLLLVSKLFSTTNEAFVLSYLINSRKSHPDASYELYRTVLYGLPQALYCITNADNSLSKCFWSGIPCSVVPSDDLIKNCNENKHVIYEFTTCFICNGKYFLAKLGSQAESSSVTKKYLSSNFFSFKEFVN